MLFIHKINAIVDDGPLEFYIHLESGAESAGNPATAHHYLMGQQIGQNPEGNACLIAIPTATSITYNHSDIGTQQKLLIYR